MLKIKDNVDLKELEKYGLIKININDVANDVYALIDEDCEQHKDYEDYDVNFYINKRRYICHCTYPEQISWTEVKDTLYDLIQAGLVEKIESDK